MQGGVRAYVCACGFMGGLVGVNVGLQITYVAHGVES